VVLLDVGHVVADDTPEQLWTHPPTAWVARFLGFRNVASARVVDDRLEMPWGSVLLRDIEVALGGPGDVTVVLRAAGLRVCADGPIRGVVSARRFGGDHVLLSVDVAGAPQLAVESRGQELPAVGETIALSVEPGAAHLIPTDRALLSDT